MKLSVILLIVCSIISLSTLSESKKVKNDASRYEDCDSCVSAGFGWSWDEHLCGSYVNTDCSNDETNTQSDHLSDDDVDESFDDNDSFDESHNQPIEKDFSWANTEITTVIWQLINAGDVDRFTQLMEHDADIWKYRSADGRGALWWAYEYGQDEIVDLLLAAGADADADATDAEGKKPAEMAMKNDL